jgi:glycerol-3-phosphate acyltransferase PlsY
MKYELMILLSLIPAAYLLGSIPFALIIAALNGKDLRKIGSGNIGATNLSRALGRKWGCFCFALDVIKGLLPMLAASRIYSSCPRITTLFLALAVGFAAVAGHIFPIYIKFKGGKGVATSFGVALGFWPYYTVSVTVAFLVWLITLLACRYISLASIAASIVFPITLLIAIFIMPGWLLSNLWPALAAAIVIAVLVVVRHHENIHRLLAGNENKISTKKM